MTMWRVVETNFPDKTGTTALTSALERPQLIHLVACGYVY